METVLRNSNNSDQEDSKTEFTEGCDPLHAQQISLYCRNCLSSPQHILLFNVENEESSVDIQVGYLYEIDHQILPPKSPNHLKTARVVMVSQKTELNVFVRFPSTLSLKNFFFTDTANQNALETSTGSHPELDELFVMSASIAGKILQRVVSFQEFNEQKLFQNFWLLPQKSTDSNSMKKDISEINDHAGDCQTALKCTSSLSWGVRRKVTYIGKSREIGSPLLMLERSHREENKISVVPKRLRRNLSRDKKQKKKRKLERSEEKSWPSKDRWSRERYESAEKKMLGIMHSKGAVLGNPILRHELRSEARKHIGDTGLLDHLLKHMDGKVVSGERFRRRHNPDGAMEYWLESADLMDIRRNAGISDPFWSPPPGWKPGDDPSCGNCSMVLKKLKEEIAHLKSDLERLLPKTNDKEADTSGATASETVSDVGDIYKSLMKRKGQLEKQLMDISISLSTMQEEIIALRNERDDVKNKSRNENISKIKSGFRMRKPQGNFLWPTPNNSVISPIITKIHVEDLVVPTPSSVSSSTSPSLLFPTSHVKPIAEKRAVTATHPHFPSVFGERLPDRR